MVTSSDPDFVTIAEAARILRVSPVTVQRWLRHGRLPAYHVGPKAVRIRRGDLERVITPIGHDAAVASEPAVGTAPIAPLSDADAARQMDALAASKAHADQQLARRGGRPFDDSWPLIRAARAARSRQQR